MKSCTNAQSAVWNMNKNIFWNTIEEYMEESQRVLKMIWNFRVKSVLNPFKHLHIYLSTYIGTIQLTICLKFYTATCVITAWISRLQAWTSLYMDGTAVNFFWWSAYMRRELGTQITPRGTTIFYNLKKFTSRSI